MFLVLRARRVLKIAVDVGFVIGIIARPRFAIFNPIRLVFLYNIAGFYIPVGIIDILGSVWF